MRSNLSIKLWALEDRPREKLLKKGRSFLSDAELLAIIIGSGSRENSAVELSQQLLGSCDFNLQEFSKKSVAELRKFKGIGEAKAIIISAALELGRRRRDSHPLKKTKITSSSVLYRYIQPLFQDLHNEEFYVIFLSRSNEVLNCKQISKGGLSETVVDGKIIFKLALEYGACGIILCHNHPSGTLKPSEEDIRLTNSLCDFGRLINLPIIDHIIYTDNGYFSFSDERKLNT